MPPGETLRAWWVLGRPAGVWIPGLLPLLGYGWAHWDRAVPVWRPEAAAVVAIAWVVLHLGTLWLNAARDRDTGGVLMGGTAPVPRGTQTLALISLIGATAACSFAGTPSLMCAAIASLLAVLYSAPAFAWKSDPILGPLTNVLGYGLVSPAAGWLIVGGIPTHRTLAVSVLLCVAVLAATFAAQIFQEGEDRARGDRTLVATYGGLRVRLVARALFGCAGLLLVLLVAIGWLPWPVLAGVPAMLLLDQHLATWSPTRPPPARGAGLPGWGLLALGAALVGATLDYLDAALDDRPVAGLSTAAGHPPDRPRLPPSELLWMDARERYLSNKPYYRIRPASDSVAVP